MDYGITSQGFNRKTYEVIIEEMITKGKQLFGNDIDLSEVSPEGIILRLVAYDIAEEWQLAEDTYYSGYVDSAEGISLDYATKYAGIKRDEGVKAKVPITITGTPGFIVPKDFMFETGGKDTKIFLLEDEVIIDELGSISTYAIAEKPGSDYNVPANTITIITNPNGNISSVNNPNLPIIKGQNIEVDLEYRERYSNSVEKGGASTEDSIKANLLDISGVRAALVIVNKTIEVDADGRPPKSVSCYVLGGQPEDIGKSILSTIAAGIEPYGSESIVVNDESGKAQTIKFTYATEKNIYVNVIVTKNDKYPIDGDVLVRNEIIRYIGGEDEDGVFYKGLGMNESVIYKKLVSVVNFIPGIEDFTLEVSTDGLTFSEENIDVAQAEVAETDYLKVVVSNV